MAAIAAAVTMTETTARPTNPLVATIRAKLKAPGPLVATTPLHSEAERPVR
jgi:hypothetical protein